MTNQLFAVDPHIKKVSKSHVWETADRWSILTGDTFMLYWPRASAAKGLKGRVGLRIVPKGYMVDQGKDYGELTHRKALEAMASYAHNRAGHIPVEAPKPTAARPTMQRDEFKDIISKCSVMLLGKLIKITAQELDTFAVGHGQSQVMCHGKTYAIHTLIVLSKYNGVYQKYGKFRDRKVISNVRTTLLTLFPIVKNAAQRYRMMEGKSIFPAKYDVNC